MISLSLHTWHIQPRGQHSSSQLGSFMPLERDSYRTNRLFVEGFED